jgi:hypothetical protein
VAKKTIRRTRYPLEDNVKRALFIRQGEGGAPSEFTIPYATRAETDAGVLLDKVLNPDVGAYAYDRFRYVGRHAAGKATRTILLTEGGNVVIDCHKSNVFRVLVTGDITLTNPINALDGQVCNVLIRQDGTGGHTVEFGTKYKLIGTVDTAVNGVSLLSMQYDVESDLWYGVVSSGFA